MTEPGSWANRDEDPFRSDSEASVPEPGPAESTASQTPGSVPPDSATLGAAGSGGEPGSAGQGAGVPGGDAGQQDNGASGHGGEVPPAQGAQNWAGGYPVSGFGSQDPQGAPGYAAGQNMTPGGVPGYGLVPQSGQLGTAGYSGTQPGYAGYQGSGAQPPAGYGQPGYSAPGGYPGYGVLPNSAVSPKTKVAGALLAFFFGGLGAHNFYFGKKNKAIVQLVLSIGAFVGIILGAVLFASGIDAEESVTSYGYTSYEDNDALLGAGFIVMGVAMLVIIAVAIWAFVEFIMILSGTQGYARDKEGRVIQ